MRDLAHGDGCDDCGCGDCGCFSCDCAVAGVVLVLAACLFIRFFLSFAFFVCLCLVCLFVCLQFVWEQTVCDLD